MKKVAKKVLNYNVLFTKEVEGGYSVMVPALPGCFSQGETIEGAVKNIQKAIKLYLEDTDSKSIYRSPNAQVNEFIIPVQVHV